MNRLWRFTLWRLAWKVVRTERRYNEALVAWKCNKITKAEFGLAANKMTLAQIKLAAYEKSIS